MRACALPRDCGYLSPTADMQAFLSNLTLPRSTAETSYSTVFIRCLLVVADFALLEATRIVDSYFHRGNSTAEQFLGLMDYGALGVYILAYTTYAI
jgi:hypothetical protein